MYTMTDKNQKSEPQTYESLSNELREISQQLRSGDTPIEEAVELVKKGNRLAKQCEEILNKAEISVNEISSDNTDDNSEN